jgi:hypothetical protein
MVWRPEKAALSLECGSRRPGRLLLQTKKGERSMDFEGASPGGVIEKVKYALGVAQEKAGAAGLGFALGSVSLELTAVQSREVGGGLKLKIPYVDWELGGDGKIAKEKTQTISVKLVPAPLKADEAVLPIDMPLADALLEVARIVHDATVNPPVLGFEEGTITLQFVLTKEGSLSLLGVDASESNVTTHKLDVGLVASS